MKLSDFKINKTAKENKKKISELNDKILKYSEKVKTYSDLTAESYVIAKKINKTISEKNNITNEVLFNHKKAIERTNSNLNFTIAIVFVLIVAVFTILYFQDTNKAN